MNISAPELVAEVGRASQQWPFIWAVEAAWALPHGLLMAIGSRETNLTNEVGDGGHGHGVWQLDDRSHNIPAGFDQNVNQQAICAAQMLRAELAAQGGSVDRAACVYNSGQPADQYTTGGDYGADVAERLAVIQQHFPAQTTASEENPMEIIAGTEPGHITYLLANGHAIPMTPAFLSGLLAAGVPKRTFDPATYHQLCAGLGVSPGA